MARVACTIVFALAGALLASFAARVPAVRERAELSSGELGLAFVGLEAGAVLGLGLGGALCARLGSRRALRVGFAVHPAALAAVGFAPSLVWLALGLAVTAAGVSLIDVAMNTQGVEIESRRDRPVLSGLHAAHSVGVLAGGLGGAAAAAAGLAVQAHLAIIAGLGAVAGQAATFALLKESVAPGPPPTWPRGRLLGLGALAFCTFLVDGAANNWSAVQMRTAHDAGEGTAAATFAIFASALVVGRVAGDRVVVRLGSVRAVRGGGVLAACGLLAALLAPSVAPALCGWFAAGLGIALVAPTVMRVAGATAGMPTPIAIATVTSVGYLGSFTGPPLIGGLASLIGLSAALGIAVSAALAVSALAGRAATGEQGSDEPDARVGSPSPFPATEV
jgi:MFS family permease